jgi:hypothetical protein
LTTHIRLVAAVLGLGAMVDSAEAKVIQYEIDGQRYAYDPKDHRQAEIAQQRIEAARAAQAARATADAELAKLPLVTLLGSPAQREAAQARARFQQLMAESADQAAPALTGSIDKPQQPRPTRTAPRAASKRPAPEVGDGQRAKLGLTPRADENTAPAPQPTGSGSQPVAQKPILKAVTFDLSSVIKTVQMTDGTVHEEALDSSTLAKLSAMEPAAEGLSTFVQQVRGRGGEASRSERLVHSQPEN